MDKPGASEWPKPKSPPPLPLLLKEPKKKAKKNESLELPARAKDLRNAVEFAIRRAEIAGPLFIEPYGRGFIVESEPPMCGSHQVNVRPDGATLFVRDQGMLVPIREFELRPGRFCSRRSDELLPIPLEEKHWRDNPKDFRTRLKIAPEKSAPDHSVCSIGKSAKDGKVYGYSHRAYHGFGKGDRFFPRLTFHSDWPLEKQDKWEEEQRVKQSKIKTDAEAWQSARNFARWVS
ncbi:hypothetical protein LCGC14_0956060 [marine sediment metagenome]|uniref:Uncharacterized protein n=1 Tax=marine sediment metagenome TaxID=412755 RepID=A0A0F9RMB2_9ZZZZ